MGSGPERGEPEGKNRLDEVPEPSVLVGGPQNSLGLGCDELDICIVNSSHQTDRCGRWLVSVQGAHGELAQELEKWAVRRPGPVEETFSTGTSERTIGN